MRRVELSMEKEIEGRSERDTAKQNHRKEEWLNETGGNEMWREMGEAETKREFDMWLIDISALRCGV